LEEKTIKERNERNRKSELVLIVNRLVLSQ